MGKGRKLKALFAGSGKAAGLIPPKMDAIRLDHLKPLNLMNNPYLCHKFLPKTTWRCPAALNPSGYRFESQIVILLDPFSLASDALKS
jgi:hypothetical protein